MVSRAAIHSTRDLRVVSGFSGTWRKGGRARMHGSPGDPKSTEGLRGVEWIATLVVRGEGTAEGSWG